jgi:Protein of unknown function (DUF998)
MITWALRLAIASFLLATMGLMTLQVLPAPRLYATTGAVLLYRPVNFLSELVRSDYSGAMVACFSLLGLGSLAMARALHQHNLRRESRFFLLAGIALLLLDFFPTDLADLSTDAITCGRPTRPEPCTLVGRIHNPLSTLVFVPIFLAMVSLYRHKERFLGRLTLLCAALMACGVAGTLFYLRGQGWQGRWWTGLTQRSLVFPALLWIGGLLRLLARQSPAEETSHRAAR